MHGRNRLANSLHKAVVVGKRSIDLGKRCRRQDDISEGGRVGLKELLDDQEVEFAQRFFAAAATVREESFPRCTSRES